MKTTFALLLFFASIAHAQIVHPGANPQLWQWPPCGNPQNVLNVAEAFALGDIFADGSTVDEGNDYLEDNAPVFGALCVVNVFYQTTVDHHVQDIILQQGSSIDVAEEWVFWVRIIFPTGKQIRFKQQYDKHAANGQGNMHVVYKVDLDIPAGTYIQITRPAVACVGIPARTVINPTPPGPGYNGDYGPYSAGNCITGESVTLVGK
jgi:hypothetical protein